MSPNQLRRKRKSRPLRTRILIVCEGTKTEPNYFKAFPVDTDVYELDIQGYGNDPRTLVDRALDRMINAEQRGEPYNQSWCVFDRDTWPVNCFQGAISKATKNNIFVAYSNQAFELWYCLHFEYLHSAIDRSDYITHLERHLKKTYQKNAKDMYTILESHQMTAIKHARRLLQFHGCKTEVQRDPSTSVYKLVETLNAFI